MKIIPGLGLSIILLITACTKDVVGPDACFKEKVLPIFISNCTMSGCHNSTSKVAGFDLSNYEGIMKGIVAKHPMRSELFSVIKGKNPSMPQNPYPKLSSKDVNIIKLWINMGARNTSNCSSCDSVNFKYDARIKNIMQLWCVGCHNASNSSAGVDLSSYSGVVSSISNNRLLGSIQHLPGYVPMPQNSGQIQKCEIDAIQNWINSGFPNN
ncbi:MAG: hypothetical protein ABIP51_09265 [Bacteroidia bacterium]